MSQVIDLTGKRFGRWTVEKFSHQKGSMFYWSCKCDCGTERAVFGADLKRGGSVSCGCFMREMRSIKSTTHGMSNHPAYSSWKFAKTRCENPNDTGYHLYGGRGIKMCERWKSDFAMFWEDMGLSWKEGLSIDRINSDGDYEPSNCKWSTPKEQANNRRTNHVIKTPKGNMNIKEAAEMFDISPDTIHARIRYGWPEEDLLLSVRPLHKKV